MKNNKKINNKERRNNGGRRGRRVRGKRAEGRDRIREYSIKISKAISNVQTHELEGIFILNSDRKYLPTKNLTPG